MNQDRWSSKFGRFVHSYGVSTLAAALDVDKTAVFHWIRGSTYPKPPHAAAMQLLAAERGIRLSLDSIYEQPREFLAQAMSAPAVEFRNESAALSRAELGPTEQKIASILRQHPQCR